MKKLNLISEENYAAELSARLDAIKQYLHCGTAESFDELMLNYEYYRSDNNTENIVIVHGYTEFLKKYEEMTVYLFDMGYNVFIYDQRGHGFSGRLVDNKELTHVDNFEDYSKDLECFIDKVVKPVIGEEPLYIVSHSMGGAVAAIYLENGGTVQKAVLSSPMIAPVANNVPAPILKLSAYIGKLRGGWAGQYKHTDGFTPNAVFENSSDLSYVRFKYNLDKRIETDEYKNSASSNRWIYESVSIKNRIIGNAKNIDVPILLITAGKDTVVKNKLHCKFAANSKNCRHVFINDAKHSIFTSSNDILKEYYSLLFDFLGERVTF